MYTFYWYPKCSTCQNAKKWLDEHEISYELKHIVEQTPTKEEFAKWLSQSQRPLRTFFNTSGMVYRQMHLKDEMESLSIERASQLLSQNGMLVKRPLILKNDQFLVNGFKKEQYEELLK